MQNILDVVWASRKHRHSLYTYSWRIWLWNRSYCSFIGSPSLSSASKSLFWPQFLPKIRECAKKSSVCPYWENAPRGPNTTSHYSTSPFNWPNLQSSISGMKPKYFSRHFVPLSIEGGVSPLFQNVSLGTYVPLSIEGGCSPLSKYFSRPLCTSFYRGVPPSFLMIIEWGNLYLPSFPFLGFLYRGPPGAS